ncbi:ATP-dependent helicase HrpA [Streptomyces sp. SolWspMP-sol7th]|nr:ATP-dependent helicase HrpA [Streptomyces sp. SolWspMP-sol7th]
MSTSPAPAPASADLAPRLALLAPRDAQRLGRRLEGTRRMRKPEARSAVLAEIETEITKAEERLAERAAHVPEVGYPPQLPVSAKKDDIADAIREHQVVIVAGETGSGKTTQIPKICLELGRGVRGMIGHTQPRRLAARTVAERVASELDTPLGEAVGWKVRFTDQVSRGTYVKLMTDGILLAEIQTDRELRAYDTIIIDEAHERSLNIDFLLGYLAQLLPRRPDLKVIITSATIDPERFSRHFGEAPIVEVSGRTYPVEVRYRPLLAEDSEEPDRDQTTAIIDAVEELRREPSGDILVFLSGEREIRDTADALEKKKFPFTEVLPLYARLSHAEQNRVFKRAPGDSARRIVLATNVAETSLTVPGIKYVIDPGTARISRYSSRTKVQRLPIEAISQASANQRKGRCGRTSDGICVRLYSEEDFESRPEFTDAEILRTNLASVILQMTSAGLGEIEKFPFIDPPDHRNIRDGVQLLQELGALDPEQKDQRKRLTQTGRRLAQLPVDPRLARMVLEADRNGCVREVMVVAAALSLQDPRERPSEKQAQADQFHARFKDETSDFLAFLNLWTYIREQQKALSSSAFRRMCRNEFLNYLRIREWQDIYAQVRSVAQQLGLNINTDDSPPEQVHVSLLAGLLSHIGMKDVKESTAKDPAQQAKEKRRGGNEYLGARGAKFAVFPGSALFKKPPRYVMSAELVETSRLWARVNARIEPEWAERLGAHLVKRAYSEPHWEKDQAAVMAYEKVTLYGVTLAAQRKVNYGRIDPEVSRELFIRNALVEGDWRTHHKFFADNRRLLTEVEELEHRARRRGIVVDDEALYDFYDERVPAHVVSGAHFDSWWKRKRQEEPELLDFERSMLLTEAARGITKDDYPDRWRQGPLDFRVTYQFEPGADADGVTVHVPLQVLNQVTSEGFDWQIPGLREEVVTELIRSLPKPVRRNYVPAPNFAQRFLATASPLSAPLTTALAKGLQQMVGVPVDGRGLRRREGPRPPQDHVPDRRRAAQEARRGQGPRRAARPAAAQGAAGALARGGGDGGAHGAGVGRAEGAHGLGGPRDAEQGLRDAARRAAGEGVPGARGRGRHRRGAALRQRGGAARGDVARDATADPPQHPGEPGEVRAGQAHQPAEARALGEPARLDAGALRGLRDGRGGPADRARGRSGVGRGGLPEAVRVRTGRDRGHDRQRGGRRAAGRGGLAGVRKTAEKHPFPRAAREPGGCTRTARRVGAPGLRDRGRADAALRSAALSAGRGPAPPADAGERAAGHDADGEGPRDAGRVPVAPGAVPAGASGAAGGAGHPVDGGGAAGQLLRARAGHGVPGLGQADREGDRRGGTVSGRSRTASSTRTPGLL